MDSSDDRELIFGLGRGMVCCGNEVGRVHCEKMDSSDDRELIFGLECWGGAMRSVCPWTSSFRKMDSSGAWYVVEMRSDEFISKNGLVR